MFGAEDVQGDADGCGPQRRHGEGSESGAGGHMSMVRPGHCARPPASPVHLTREAGLVTQTATGQQGRFDVGMPLWLSVTRKWRNFPPPEWPENVVSKPSGTSSSRPGRPGIRARTHGANSSMPERTRSSLTTSERCEERAAA